MIPYLAAYVALNTTGLLLLRWRLRDGSLTALATDPIVLLGAVFYASSFFTWLVAIRYFELTRVMPIFLGSSYVVVVIAAVLLLGEQLTLLRLAGITLVGAGLLLLVR